MSTFESLPDDNYRMKTWITPDTRDTLKSFRDFGGESVTKFVTQAVSAHSWFSDCHRADGLVIATSPKSVETLIMPPEVEVAVDAGRVLLDLTVHREITEYVMPRVDTDDMDDLTAFWGSAISFYNDLVERRLGGATFHGILPGENLSRTNTYTPDSPFDQ